MKQSTKNALFAIGALGVVAVLLKGKRDAPPAQNPAPNPGTGFTVAGMADDVADDDGDYDGTVH